MSIGRVFFGLVMMLKLKCVLSTRGYLIISKNMLKVYSSNILIEFCGKFHELSTRRARETRNKLRLKLGKFLRRELKF